MSRYAVSSQFKNLPRKLENLGKGVLSCKVCFCCFFFFFFSSTLSAHNIRLLSELEDAMEWK